MSAFLSSNTSSLPTNFASEATDKSSTAAAQDVAAASCEYALTSHEWARKDASIASTMATIDRDDAEVIEVSIRWGRTVLGVHHVKLGERFVLGDDAPGARVAVPAAAVGGAPFTLVEGGVVQMPPGAVGARRGVDGVAVNLDALTGAPLALARGESASLTLAGDGMSAPLTLDVRRVAAANRSPRGLFFQRGLIGVGLASFALHAAITAALSISPGPALDDEDASIDRATAAQMIAMYQAAADHETPEQAPTDARDEAPSGGKTGAAHSGAQGAAGSLTSTASNKSYAIAGSPETKAERLANIRASIEANDYAALGALSAALGSMHEPIDPDSAFATSLGDRPKSYDGNLLGAEEGDAFGYQALGRFGTGPGGGSLYDGLGLDRVGTFGHGPGDGGPDSGIGGCMSGPCSRARIGHTTGGGHIIDKGGEVTGSLPREVVQRIIRANFPRIRACYDSGLKRDPSMRGTVKTRFIIDSTGAVESASLASSTLTDGGVSACVVGVFSTMSFPEPEHGKAMVVYPIDLDVN